MNSSLNNLDRQTEIMIVDDDLNNLFMLERMLNKAGYLIRQAEDGASAYTEIIRQQPDLILLDIIMPTSDGYELCKELKSNPATKDIPVIFISALDGGNDIAKAFMVGGTDYIVKPFKKEEILFRVKNQLELAQARKKLNQQIDEQLIFQHDLLNSIPNPIYFTGLDGVFRGCNSAFEKCFGLQNEELSGKTVQELSQNRNARYALEYFRNLNEIEQNSQSPGQNLSSIETKVEYVDGTRHDTITSKTVYHNNRNSQQHIIYVLTDITGLLILEEKLRRSQKMEAIGVLASGIAHEINSPMQYILDNTRFLEDSVKIFLNLINELSQHEFKCEPENYAKLREFLQSLDADFLNTEIPLAISENINGINKIRSIISALKDFTYPRGFNLSETDINKNLETVLLITGSNWKPVAKLEKRFSGSLPIIPCYADELNQVWINLIVNAVDAIKEKGIKNGLISISTALAGDFVVISVSDNGTGIPAELKSRIFEPFFTTKDVGKGTGQGLAIVYDIIYNLHHGSIELNSEVGKGTEFIIKLPIEISN